MIKKVLIFSLMMFSMLFSLFSSNLIKANSNYSEEKEVVELRGKDYKVFEKDNKRFIKYYFSPVHYVTSKGFQEYDYSIVELDDCFEKEYDKYSVIFPKQIRSGKYIEYNFNNEKVEFMLDYSETLYGEITYINDEQFLRYKTIKGITCLEIEIYPEHIKIYDLKKCNNFGTTEIKFKNEKNSCINTCDNKIGYVVNNKTFLLEISSSNTVAINKKEDFNENNIKLMRTNQIVQDCSTYSLETTDIEDIQVMTITNNLTSNTTLDISDYIEDKFIVEGNANYSYTLNELRNNKIGLKSSGLMDENEEPFAIKMKQIVNLDSMMNKLILTPGVESFKLVYTRTGGRELSSMNGVTLQANKIISDLDYVDINGTTTYETEFINNLSQYNSTGYEVDLTTTVNDYIEFQDTENFIIEIDSSGFVAYNYQTEDIIQFGSSRHNLKKPYILIEFGTSSLGAALDEGTVEGKILDSHQNGAYNCFGYALNKKINAFPYLTDDQLIEGTYLDVYAYIYEKHSNQSNSTAQISCDDFSQTIILSSNLNYDVSMRKLNSVNDAIYNYEYRIACRIGSIEFSEAYVNNCSNLSEFTELMIGIKAVDCHFLRQNKLTTGIFPLWSGKNGQSDFTYGINIVNYIWVCNNNEQFYNENGEFYDSETVYFAVSVL